MDFWRLFFTSEGFIPRRHCGEWDISLILLHTGSDVVIWLSYMIISLLLLLYYRYQAQEFPYPRLILLFVLFINFCGWTHFDEIMVFWHPAYRVFGVIKLITATASILTVMALLWIAGKFATKRPS